MRKFSFAAALLLLACMLFSPCRAQAADLKLFRVDSAEDLLALAEHCRLDRYSEGLLVTLTEDVDLSGLDFPGIPSFAGSFDGRGHTISGLNLKAEGSVQGLFRYLREGALVEDLHIQGILSPGGSAATVGGIAGHNAGTLLNCSFSGIVSGTETVGGIVGINTLSGVLRGCRTDGAVHGSHFVGGIAGENTGVIENCANFAEINTTLEQNQISLEDITLESITGVESAATVTDIGGICGTGSGVIRSSENHGPVGYPKVGYNIGGIIGSTGGYVVKCTNHGAIHGRKDVGGIAGQLEPSVHMLFEEDTLQILEKQMQTMSDITNTTAAHAQSAAADLKAQIGSLDQQVRQMQGALESLLPGNNDSVLPDADTILAAQNQISSGMSAISGILDAFGSTVHSSAGILSDDLNALTGQMHLISDTLNSAQENLGGSVQDLSDADTESDTSSKLFDCQNLASLSGDWNVGGIVGAIGPESDLDPETDLLLTGSLSANFDLSFRAVILECDNRGSLTRGKQHLGGIAGWASLGLIRNCVNRGNLDAPGSEYVGGIAGLSGGFIRNCCVRGSILSDRCSGGIAGTASTVSDCYSLVQLDGSEKIGAILGFAEDLSAISGNHYLRIGSDIGAIDGISYANHAYALDAEEFFTLAGLPSDFDSVTIRFILEDGSVKTLHRPFGHAVGLPYVPALPQREGFVAQWDGPADLSEPLYFDIQFTAVYTPLTTVIASDLRSPSGRPRMLAQGMFSENAVLALNIREDNDALCAWDITLPAGQSELTLRILPPETVDGTQVTVQLQRNGSWETVPSVLEGSYLVFTSSSDFHALRLVPAPTDHTVYWLAGFCVLFAAALILLIVLIKRCRKRQARK